MKEYYENKVAAVTGGASGIGLALVEAMLEMGARAVTIADINEDNLNKHCARLSDQYPGKVKGLKTDVTSEASVKAMVDAAVAFGGGHIDLLFNNAGLGLGGAFEEQGNEQWGKAFAINFYSVVYGVRAALPYMKAQKPAILPTPPPALSTFTFLTRACMQPPSRLCWLSPPRCVTNIGTTASAFPPLSPVPWPRPSGLEAPSRSRPSHQLNQRLASLKAWRRTSGSSLSLKMTGQAVSTWRGQLLIHSWRSGWTSICWA